MYSRKKIEMNFCFDTISITSTQMGHMKNEYIKTMEDDVDKDAIILELRKQIEDLKKDNKFLLMENNFACDKGYIIGDGNTTYSEWFENFDFSPEELEEYKEWLGYETEESDEDNESDEDKDGD